MTAPRALPVSKVYPWRRDAEGNRICAVCNKRCSRKYCSDACRNEAYVRCDPGYARFVVYRRDCGVCAVCGCDTDKIDRILKWVRKFETRCDWGHWPGRRAAQATLGFTRDHLWEVDHIRPVAEGGGLCGLDNLRTLCTPCHDAETATLRRRLAAQGTADGNGKSA